MKMSTCPNHEEKESLNNKMSTTAKWYHHKNWVQTLGVVWDLNIGVLIWCVWLEVDRRKEREGKIFMFVFDSIFKRGGS